MQSNRKIKVIYVHHSPTFGGSSKSLGLIISELRDMGVEPYIICPPGSSNDFFREITNNVYTITHKAFPLLMTVVGMKSNVFHYWRNFAKVKYMGLFRKLFQDIQADIVHCNELGLTLVSKEAKKQGIPVVLHARCMPEKKHSWINNFTQHQINKHSDHVICITGSVYNWLNKVRKKTIIYNPVERLSSVNVFNGFGSPLVLLSLSSLQKNKGVFDIVEAARILKNEQRILFRIAGKIQRFDPEKLTKKQRILMSLGLLDLKSTERLLDFIVKHKLKNVELLDHVDDIDVELKRADIMLAPMQSNAPPRSVYEAGIYGIPSILAMEDKVEDVVQNNVNGILIDEERPDQLVQAILQYVDSPELIKIHGKNARDRFMKNHDAKLSATQVYKIYCDVLDK